MEPSIGENVSNGAGEGLKAFARTGGRQTHGVVEGEMAFIEGVRASREGGLVETIPRQSLCNSHMIRQRPRRLSNPRIVRVHLGPNSSCQGRAFCLTKEDYASTVARRLQVTLPDRRGEAFVPAETPFVLAQLPKPNAHGLVICSS